MRTAFATILLALLSLSATAEPTVSSDLVGSWTSRSVTGVATHLDIQANGRFVLRQAHSEDLRRDYLCGSLTDTGEALVLSVESMKERFENGDIEQLAGAATVVLPVHRRTGQTLIIDYKSKTVVLNAS